MICPEKSAALPQFLPKSLSISSQRPVKRLCNSVDNIIYPAESLRSSEFAERTYPKTDTHFSDIGAAIVSSEILRSFGVDPHQSFSNIDYQETEILGDLGIKLEDKPRSVKYFDRSSVSISEKDNGLRNRGRVTKYHNTEAAEAERPTLLLFGDSFSGINVGKMLCNYFSTVHFIHSGSIDYGLVGKLKPDYVVSEYAERFLLNAPVEALPLSSVVAEKLMMSTYDDKMLEDFTGSFEEFSEYLTVEDQKMLQDLAEAV